MSTEALHPRHASPDQQINRRNALVRIVAFGAACGGVAGAAHSMRRLFAETQGTDQHGSLAQLPEEAERMQDLQERMRELPRACRLRGGTFQSWHAPGSKQCIQLLVGPHIDKVPRGADPKFVEQTHRHIAACWTNMEHALADYAERYPRCFPEVVYVESGTAGKDYAQERVKEIRFHEQYPDYSQLPALAVACATAPSDEQWQVAHTKLWRAAGIGPIRRFLAQGMQLRGPEDERVLHSADQLQQRLHALMARGVSPHDPQALALAQRFEQANRARDRAIISNVQKERVLMPLVSIGHGHGQNLYDEIGVRNQENQPLSVTVIKPDGLDEFQDLLANGPSYYHGSSPYR
jgi:hypothetical protein